MILITRPKKQSKSLLLKLNSHGYQTFHESIYSIKYLKYNLICDKKAYYIFPSLNSVQSLVENKQINKFYDSKIFAIGSKVKEALKQHGCKKIIKTTESSKELTIFLKNSKFKQSKFIYLGSNSINHEFFQKIKKQNIYLEKKTIYKTTPRLKFTKNLIKKIESSEIKAVLLYSLLATENFLKLLSRHDIKLVRKKLKFFCISDRVASPLKSKKFKSVYIANKPNQNAIIQSVRENLIL